MSAPEGTQPGVGGLLTRAAATWPDHPAVRETGTGRGLTYRQVEAAVQAQAGRLAGAGVEPGDRVALRLPTSVDFVVAFFGALRAGAVVVPLSPQAPGPELEKLLGHSGAKVVITRDADEVLPDGVTGLTPESDPDGPSEIVDDGRAGSGEDIAVVSYTSGTTGPPRGVMLSHRALLANLAQLGGVEGVLTHDDRVLITIPLFHVYGLGPGLLQAVSAGATAVLSERFEAQRTLDDCAEHGVTTITGVPTMYAEFAALGTDELQAKLTTVRRMTSGAAPLHPKVLGAIREATGLDVYEGYGLTECAPVVTSTLVTGYPKPGSVGRPLPGVELRLVDSDGTDQAVPLDPDDVDDVFEAEGETGLVSIRGANLFSGYWPDGGARARRRGLVPHRRRRLPRRRRRPAPGRPGQRPDHRQRLQRLPARGRGGHRAAVRGGRGGGRRCRRRAKRRSGEGVRGAGGRGVAVGAAGRRPLRGPPGRVQGAARGRVRRVAAALGHRQAAPRAVAVVRTSWRTK